ncbi:lysophospholipid acyltransferase family protein [Frankia nepalensis]|uniref:1-acyl-sn-glycerol-3-phosphate acyltransferase n=1 Tax=Frankia nepalensis TaxID=1836974 RepID=A0A937US33_9ACTN|nr:lysophospholipid acyltransferase family protein [Frankia nepalensis]MBL7497781.1 1-acyl-sn-glycerol-3-phosphate acyltransferase [Frankia nepalensis]MBL7511284.1 1-acyl-sn-glycerol-3-phosphate acyltransferase [Frankia nepalensis]MBL7629850.1 1-acyl-sn-glycerol-3-phosphate acyltransferase [Frankia nepalensis]
MTTADQAPGAGAGTEPAAEPSTAPAGPVAERPAAESAAAEPAALTQRLAAESTVTVVEPAPAALPVAAGGGAKAPVAAARQPAHRGAESTPYNDILHRVLKPPVRWWLNHVVMRITLDGVERVPRGEPLIFAGNHSSWLDGPLVVIESPRTVRCLTKVEMYKGIVGWLLRLVGQIPIDRGKADRVALHTALDELARGNAIGVFPEGTRGSGEMAAVQHGIAYLAVHGRCRVLPVACLGTGDALPKGARWPRRSARVRVVFGEPFAVEIPANPRSRKALAAVAEDIRVRLADHLTTARATTTD